MEQHKAAVMTRGFPNNGSWIRHAKLRNLTGYDEQFMFDIHNSVDEVPTFVRTIELLKRIVTFDRVDGKSLTDNKTVDTETIFENMRIGDRNALLLTIRKLVIGDKIQGTVACPNCKEGMSFEISTGSLLKRQIPVTEIEYIVNIESFTVKIRPVTGLDERAILQQNSFSPSKRLEQLVRSCIISSDPALMSDTPLSNDFIEEMSSHLSEIDPLADIVLDLVCPSCQEVFKTPFFVDDFIFQELNERHVQFESEVHWLAFNYHWSEDAILSLPIKKRKRYIELINTTLCRGGEDFST